MLQELEQEELIRAAPWTPYFFECYLPISDDSCRIDTLLLQSQLFVAFTCVKCKAESVLVRYTTET
jgi:hypothetical protein